MKIKLVLLLAMIFLVITCSIPGEPGKNITIEDYTLSITFNNDHYGTESLDSIEALLGDDTTLVQVKSLRINAFINNHIATGKVLYEVNISETANLSANSLTGDIINLIRVQLPEGTGTYTLDNPDVLSENQGLDINSEGISLNKEIINMMLHKDMYIKSTMRVESTVNEDDSLEAQVKMTGHFLIKTKDEE